MALIGLKGGGYVAIKSLEAIGKTGAEVAALTKDEQQAVIAQGNVPVFDTWQAADAYLNSPAFKTTLTSDDKDGIAAYTGSGYQTINSALVKQATLGVAPTGYAAEKIAKFDAALLKLPKYQGELERKFNVKSLETFLEGYQVGKKVTWHAYTSASTGTSPMSGNVQVTVHASGKNAHPIFKLSTVPSEHEVLFRRGTTFHINSITPIYKEQIPTKSVPDMSMPKYSTLKSGKQGKKIIGYWPKEVPAGPAVKVLHSVKMDITET